MNQTIQILRGTSANIVKHANAGESLLDGQLLYNTDKNYLTVGGGGNNSLTKHPISCRELVGYTADDSSITTNKTTEYRLIAGDTTKGFLFEEDGVECASICGDGVYLPSANTSDLFAARVDQVKNLIQNAIATLDSSSTAVSSGYVLTGITITDGKITARSQTNSITNATQFSSARTIALTGSVTGSASANGSAGWSITTTTNHNHNAEILELLYPVGAIYITISSTFDPNGIFVGTWIKIEDAYLYAKQSSETAGSMYGDTDYKISTDQLPAHTHTMAHTHTGPSHSHSWSTSNSGSHTHGMNSGGTHQHLFGTRYFDTNATGKKLGLAPVDVPFDSDDFYNTSGYGSHTHSINSSAHSHSGTTGAAGTGNTGAASTSTTSSVGSGSAYKPKYLAVIVWKRTA